MLQAHSYLLLLQMLRARRALLSNTRSKRNPLQQLQIRVAPALAGEEPTGPVAARAESPSAVAAAPQDEEDEDAIQQRRDAMRRRLLQQRQAEAARAAAAEQEEDEEEEEEVRLAYYVKT